MACTRAVVVVVLGSILALTQVKAVSGKAQTTFSFGSGSAQSQVTDNDGTVRGECSYMDTHGQNIKVSYIQAPGGSLEAVANPPVQNAVEALNACRRNTEAHSEAAKESFQRSQQQILQQQQQLQDAIFRQNQEIQQQLQHQIPQNFGFPQQFPFIPQFR